MKYFHILLFFSTMLQVYSQDINENIRVDIKDNKSIELNHIKGFIKEYIENFGYEYSLPKRRLMVSYVDDYLRLIYLNKDGSKEIKNIRLYDFSKVYKFDAISKRRKELAYINIYISALSYKTYTSSPLVDKKPGEWIKHKFILRVNGHENAEIILNAFKEYNRLLLLKKEINSTEIEKN